MRVLSIPELQTIYEPHVQRLGRAIWPLMEQYEAIPIEIRVAFGLITQANILHSLMVGNVQREFSGVDGVTLRPGPNESLYLCIDALDAGIEGTAVTQFKKLDNDNRSRNYQTSRQERMRDNALPLIDVERPTFADAGYVFNDLGTTIRTVTLVRLLDQKLIFEIPEQRNGSISIVPPSGNAPLPTIEPRFNVFRRKEKGTNGDDGSE